MADCLTTGGLVIGRGTIADQDFQLDGQKIDLRLDDMTVFEGVAKHPFVSLTKSLDVFSDRGGVGLSVTSAGMVVTTGTLIPVQRLGGDEVWAKVG